ncbi:uncharacterized protein TNIN_441041 [Trichonephila inaurata madagascariensis]|uniref:Uncharacterized protein n=1 Tax=Trichonephila inaurata madagascariensis TaxID=2747483 RepID=A0A8X6X9Y4_9ARAC|nr:uncharacterized protein TNIN_441041 [Trichonephila inaurata madagascariensis]
MGEGLNRNSWQKGEFISSPEYPITDTCSIYVHFYLEGEFDDKPIFKLIRTNTNGSLSISGDWQLCHGETIAKWYILKNVFENGESTSSHYLPDVGNAARFKIFHSLPELCFRLIYKIEEA